MSIFNTLTSLFLKTRISGIEHFNNFPLETQKKVFHYLLEMGKSTAWGEKFGFRGINSIKEFQEKVPLSHYEDIFPWINRALKGEKNVLWPGEVLYFSKSSGTTNDKSKFIPVSKESLEDTHYEAGRDMLALYYSINPDSQLFSGKNLSIGGSHSRNPQNPKAIMGDISAMLIENMPFYYELFRSPSKEVALMSEWEAKIDRMAKEAMSDNITGIGGVPTWTLVLIKRIFELSGNTSGNLLDIWPNLELFCHGGVDFSPYRKQFEALIPSSQMHYLNIYNASEGFFSVQDQKDNAEMLLLLDHGIFYEFIPLEEIDDDQPTCLTLDEVKEGPIYALVITTNGGLWRYIIGDTVRFTDTNPFRISIAGRTKHFINAFGEELMMENASAAISAACQKTGASVGDFTAAPVYLTAGQKGCHEWLIEFDIPPENLALFSRVLDETLQLKNSDYEAKRYKELALVAPIVRIVPKGTFYNWLRKKGKLGGQNKVPKLSNSRVYVEEILLMLEDKHSSISR